MRRLLLCLAVLAFVQVYPWVTFVRAAAAIVQIGSAFGNDQTITFGAAPSASNCLIIVTVMGSETATIDITGNPVAEATLVGPVDSVGDINRFYAFAMVGDGADTTYIVTTSGGSTATSAGIELSGMGTCDATLLDDSESADVTDGSGPFEYTLPTALTTSASGAVVIALMASMSGAADWAAVGDDGTVDAGDDEISTSPVLASYQIVGAAGSYNVNFTSVAGETGYLNAVALKAAVVAGGCRGALSLLGVGGC